MNPNERQGTTGLRQFLVRGERPGDDPIFALNQEANARKAQGTRVVNATIGVLLKDDGTLAVLPTAARAMSEVPSELWAPYAPISGDPEFLRAVAEDLFPTNAALRDAAVVVATPGGSGAIRHAVATFLEPGQALLTTSFYWGPYATIADECERRVATFDMFQSKTSAERLNLDALDRKLGELIHAQGRALLFLNDPCHNPTGYSMTDADWADTAAIIDRHAEGAPVTVVLDAAYSAYGPTGVRVPLAHLARLVDRALVLVAWSASKTFTHYGLRVGALAALVPDSAERRRIQSAFGYASRGTWSNCNRGGMFAIRRLLTDPALRDAAAAERGELVRLLGDRVHAFNEAARAHGLLYPRYDGGFFVAVFTDDAKGAAERMKTSGVFVVPVPGALRVALCSVPKSDVPTLVDALAEHVAG